jgi:SAM-dependent methyltransferase
MTSRQEGHSANLSPYHPNTPSPTFLNDDVRRIWDAKAAFWDERMGDGNAFQRELIGPAVEGLLAIQPGERVLDVGCGNGVSTRRLAELGAHVLGIDYSASFLELARARVTTHDERIDYQLVDASDETALLALGEGQFDALVCNMVLMDMPVIDPLLRAARRLLTPAGRFVFSIQHPAFNSNDVRLCAEAATGADGREITTHSVRITDYLTTPAGKGSGMPGEPEPHWYFHRPLHELFGAFFRAGFVLDGLDEPRFAAPHQDVNDRALSWFNLPGIPPVLVGRCIPRP